MDPRTAVRPLLLALLAITRWFLSYYSHEIFVMARNKYWPLCTRPPMSMSAGYRADRVGATMEEQ